jgi:hypothetical protein
MAGQARNLSLPGWFICFRSRCMGDCAERVHLAMAVEPVITTAAYTSCLEYEGRAWVERIWRAGHCICCACQHGLYGALRHFAKLAEDERCYSGCVRRGHGSALGICVTAREGGQHPACRIPPFAAFIRNLPILNPCP